MKPVMLLTIPRSILGIFVFFPIVMILCTIFGLANIFTINNLAFSNFIVKVWSEGACAVFGVNLIITGREKVKPGGCIYLFNHTSFFDIFAVYAMDPAARFGAKIELFKVPIFGLIMRKFGTLPIPRQNRAEAIRVYEAATGRVKNGQRFALAPEGSRGEGGTLKPFKAGPFVFGINCNVPLVPVVIHKAQEIWPKGAIIPALTKWKYDLRVDILEPVSVDGIKVEDREILQKQVYHAMESKLFCADGAT